MDVGPGRHDVALQPGTAPKQAAVALVDLRRQVSAKQTVTISHPPISRAEEVSLPQNWAWEQRRMKTVSLPPLQAKASKE